MNARWLRLGFFGVALVGSTVFTVETTDAALTTNAWIVNNGKWETPGNWSHGAPSTANAINFIANGSPMGGAVVTIDATTAGTIPSPMTVSNLTVSSFGEPHELFLNNAGSTELLVLNTLFLRSGGVLTITNSVFHVGPVSASIVMNGNLVLRSGTILVAPGLTEIAQSGGALWTVFDGTWLSSSAVRVGSLAGSAGTLTTAGGTNTLLSSLTLGVASGAHGTAWLTGGQLDVSSSSTDIGFDGIGQMTVSNGSWKAQVIFVGENFGSEGTLAVAGGSVKLVFGMEIGYAAGATGTMWLTGGQFNVTNSPTWVADGGVGRMTVSNGTWQAQDVYVGELAGSQGTLTLAGGMAQTRNVFVGDLTGSQGTLAVAGGTNTLNRLYVGNQASATGTVWLTGGQLTTPIEVQLGAFGVGQMTVSNGTWQVNGMGVALFPTSQATLTMAGGIVTCSASFSVGGNAGATGTVWLTGGQLTATNSPVVLGSSGVGRMTVSNGTWRANEVDVAYSHVGTLTMNGGTVTLDSYMKLALFGGATGTVWLTGGQLIVTNADTWLGGNGPPAAPASVGRMTVSNGTWRTQYASVGVAPGSQGTLTINGGTNTMFGLLMGANANATGTVWLTGGQLIATNDQMQIGANGIGRMTVSNGTWLTAKLLVGNSGGSQGTLTVLGGNGHAYGGATLGATPCTSTGVVTIAGGNLFATNAAHNAIFEVRSGTLTVSAGTLETDIFVMTNACSHFARTGGNLIYDTAVLDPDRDDDGDGLSNGYEQSHGLDPLDPTDGIPPGFRMISITRQGNNILLTWTTPAGTTNQVQVTSGAANGSYSTNGFSNLGAQMFIGGSGVVTTNYTDTNGATNKPAGYYRIRLVP